MGVFLHASQVNSYDPGVVIAYGSVLGVHNIDEDPLLKGRENFFYLATLIRIDKNIHVDVPPSPISCSIWPALVKGARPRPAAIFKIGNKHSCIQNGKSKSASVRAFSA